MPRPRRCASRSRARALLRRRDARSDLPKRKSGLWEIYDVADRRRRPGRSRRCASTRRPTTSRASSPRARSSAASRTSAAKATATSSESVCRIGESTATTRAVITGNFDSAYQADIEAKYSPPLMGMSEGRSTMSARWLGPCRAGPAAGRHHDAERHGHQHVRRACAARRRSSPIDERHSHGAQPVRHAQGTEASLRRDRAVLFAAGALQGGPSEGRAAAGVDPHRARIGAAQLRRQEGHRGARAAARELGADRRRAPTRSRSSSRASCCRTSPACRCSPTSRRCATSPTRWARTRRRSSRWCRSTWSSTTR